MASTQQYVVKKYWLRIHADDHCVNNVIHLSIQ